MGFMPPSGAEMNGVEPLLCALKMRKGLDSQAMICISQHILFPFGRRGWPSVYPWFSLKFCIIIFIIACCSTLFRKIEKCLSTSCSIVSFVYFSFLKRIRSSIFWYMWLYSSFVGSMVVLYVFVKNCCSILSVLVKGCLFGIVENLSGFCHKGLFCFGEIVGGGHCLTSGILGNPSSVGCIHGFSVGFLIFL